MICLMTVSWLCSVIFYRLESLALTLYCGVLLMNWLTIPERPPILGFWVTRFIGFMPKAFEAMLATLAIVPMFVIMLPFFIFPSIDAA